MTRPRRKLRELELLDGARSIRTTGLILIGVLSALAALGFTVGAHRAANGWSSARDYGDWHSFALEAWMLPLLLPACTVALARWAAQGGIGRGIATGLVALASGIVIAMAFILNHLFDVVDGNALHDVAGWSQLVASGLGVILVVVEPILYLVTRRALEREDPVFPTARVVRR